MLEQLHVGGSIARVKFQSAACHVVAIKHNFHFHCVVFVRLRRILLRSVDILVVISDGYKR